MSEEKKLKNGTNEPIYDECDSCDEMLVLTQCPDCKKWVCSRCYYDHECKNGVWITR